MSERIEPPFISDGPCGEDGGCAAMPGCRCTFTDGPPFVCPDCAATREALTTAVRMLDNLAAEGHNLDLDVMRWRRWHHAALTAAGIEDA